MADLRIVQSVSTDALTLDLLQLPSGQIDETQALATAVILALGTDRRANDDDILPDPDSDDRRGWWGDTDAGLIWGGWPIGSRLWLLDRAKITGPESRDGSTVARVEQYVREALQPFITAKIASRIDVSAERTATSTIIANVTIFRGPRPAVSLQFQSLWDEIAA